MIFPIGDDNSDRTTTPYVNYIFIAINIFVFVLLQGLGSNTEFTYSFSTVPEEIITGEDLVTDSETVTDPVTGDRYLMPGLEPTPFFVYITLLTSMFMHGGMLHLFGNMLYLWIFGDNLEHALGHIRYFLFYMVCGVIASLAHVAASVFMDANLLIPSLGASGAISGVLGGYILLFPKRKVRAILVRSVVEIPAFVALGIWIVFQLISGFLSAGQEGGGVAYGAHIGGFFAGLILVKFFTIGRKNVTPI
ncbi:MAG TPA: rhomboid family intramembrane serine protease [Ignavibacteria bacterium]|nr:rhomboid family intramembrane serine protease [Ignavibacteria bacterium]